MSRGILSGSLTKNHDLSHFGFSFKGFSSINFPFNCQFLCLLNLCTSIFYLFLHHSLWINLSFKCPQFHRCHDDSCNFPYPRVNIHRTNKCSIYRGKIFRVVSFFYTLQFRSRFISICLCDAACFIFKQQTNLYEGKCVFQWCLLRFTFTGSSMDEWVCLK